MKIFLGILALLVVSACAGQLKPKPLEFEENKRYVYEYIGSVITGIPSISNLYSGFRIKANVEISHIVNENGVHLNAMQLTNISYIKLIDEVISIREVDFNGHETFFLRDRGELLELPVQYHINYETQHLEWIEVNKNDRQWSLNIKKAIIEMFLVDIAGKQLKLVADHEHTQTRGSHDEVLHSFDVYEPSSKGECETMYQVINDLPEGVSGLTGVEQFYWKVIKSRNYQNCYNASVYTQHNWERNGCAEYCKKDPISGENRMTNDQPFKKPQCFCDEVKPLDQQSTSTYYIECMSNPYIIKGESSGKIAFDNHGTKFISYTNQTLKFVRISGGPVNRINDKDAIRASNLTFILHRYLDSSESTSFQGLHPDIVHEIPIYNLLIPAYRGDMGRFNLLLEVRIFLNNVADTIMSQRGEKDLKREVTRSMTRVVQNLAHLDFKHLMRIYQDQFIVPEDKLYTNTLKSVQRQLFLDAISHVGTRSVVEWLDKVINESPDTFGLFPMEVRQVIETLPLNVYRPTTKLIDILRKKIQVLIMQEDWDTLSAYVVSYGKLIAKACPHTGLSFIMEEEDPKDERCSVQKTFQYIVSLAMNLARTKPVRGKVLIAQALAHSGKMIALKYLEPYVRGQLICTDDTSDCTFLRTTIIYSLHHLVPVEAKQIRSLLLPIFSNKTESYEIRLAAFTVLMSAGPKRHELDSVASSLQSETNLQVISMVRSILEETANLTQAFHQPLARAAREIVEALPQVNLNGVYSQASYNEWYSTDTSTGIFANSRFIANNISYIPRHGYLSLGYRWKSLSNSWLTVAFQQKGLETALKKLLYPESPDFYAYDPKTIDELWKDRGVKSRNEDQFMIKFFIRVYEKTSLFTMDEITLRNAYKQFVRIMRNFVSNASNNEVDFHWVRFYMPSSYIDIVPTAIGLPIAAIKQNSQIVSLRLTKSDSEPSQTSGLTSGNISFQFTPQIFTSSHFSLSVFDKVSVLPTNYGVHTDKLFNFYAPLNLTLGWNLTDKSFTYAIKPVFDKIKVHSSNTNFAFIAQSRIGFISANSLQSKKIIKSLVPAYTPPLMQLKSREFGMNLNVNMSTERPWFIDVTKIPCDGTVAWLLEKYNEMNQFNNNINLTLVQNEEFPATGIAGSFRYEQDISGKFVTIGEKNSVLRDTVAKEIGEDLIQRYPSRISDPAFFARSWDMSLTTLGHPEPTTFNSTLTLVRAVDYHAYWYRLNSTLDNKNEDLWTRIARRLVIDGKLERPTFPSDLEWNLENPEDLVGNYIANIAWSHDVTAENVDTKIMVNGQLKRSVRDPVIPEMERRSWFHKQCEKNIKNGNATNHACERVFNEQAYFNVVTGKIEFHEVEEPVRESIRKVYSELKRSLTYYWKPWSTISSEKIQGEENVVAFEVAYSNIIYQRPVISLLVQTETEKVNFTKIFVPVAPFPAMHPIEYLKASSLPKDQTCTVMKDSIRTFDNVTYYTWIDECEFIAAMDCASNSKQFAVTVKGKAGKRSIRVYTPLNTYFKVYDVKKDSATLTIYGFNNQRQGPDYILRPGIPAIHLQELTNSKYEVFMHDGVVNVVLLDENVRIAFDGYYLKIKTSPLYIGKTCGLCGNQDQEFYPEFLDPKMTDLASNLTAFRDSYSLHNCIDPNPCHDSGCDSPMVHHSTPKFLSSLKSSKKVTTTSILKTLVFERQNEVCFSKYPQKVCKKGETPSLVETESKIIDLVCLQKTHPLYSQYIADSEKRLITEVSLLDKTETLSYKIPVACVLNN